MRGLTFNVFQTAVIDCIAFGWKILAFDGTSSRFSAISYSRKFNYMYTDVVKEISILQPAGDNTRPPGIIMCSYSLQFNLGTVVMFRIGVIRPAHISNLVFR
jgi:hypothetical protein